VRSGRRRSGRQLVYQRLGLADVGPPRSPKYDGLDTRLWFMPKNWLSPKRMRSIRWWLKVYAIEEIVVEKLLALSDRARNEPRDLYDLWYLFHSKDLRIAEMRAELDAKLAFRQRVVAGMEQAIATKEDRLRRLWVARLAHQMTELPPYDDVFREVLRVVRAADLPGP
jgi:predicted nucleotidyltransferase component of viral defense system